ncbi:tripartite tricarboxylate transporter substrate binding protein [Roseomonas terrae]|uniref:Tripartite tricarboxylate transporter substrate binding protein n=1 Tax=Neoroseomonas terrae TaxID=424799 RepID=A0ABS5EQ57_9PROT|nr:tripartite tricarboxylate transporter substrate binding protein [Neoroseomonas terrae]MBR0653178.1 tripartite tricarboxylate transporter substrate binding protein [Neoroseomonas terrae]
MTASLSRRQLAFTAGAAAWPVAASAQAYPNGPIRMIVPYVAGGNSDVVARRIAAKLGERLGVPVVVENRTGAGGAIGTETVVRAAPDGQTLLFHSAAVAIEPSMRNDLSYNVREDLVPITQIAETPFAFLVNNTVPARTIPEFIVYAKANPGKLNFGTPGAASSVHLSIEWFCKVAGIEMVHVPYRGAAPTLLALTANEIQLVLDAVSTAKPHATSGMSRALAVASAQRSTAWPELPTVKETGVDYSISIWHGFFAPARTSPTIAARLNTEIRGVMEDAEMKRWSEQLGLQVTTSPDPAAFRAFFLNEINRWAEIVRQTGVQG